MKKILFAILLFTMMLALCACGTDQMPEISATEDASAGSPDETSQEAPTKTDAPASIELSGPWHLDSEKNDLTAFQDIFPAYAEFGARMEIKSDGQLSWCIGIEGGSGTYTQDGDILTADLVSDIEQKPMTVVFHVIPDNETACLVMEYNETSVYWIYGESGEPNAAGE